jgi:hypothetical protein
MSCVFQMAVIYYRKGKTREAATLEVLTKLYSLAVNYCE